MPYWLLVIIFSILLIPGLIGVFLPVIPSIPLMFVVALIFSIIDGFEHLTALNITILGVIAVVSIIIDYTAGIIGAYGGGASKGGIFGGLLGGLIGVVFFPPWGLIIGMILGVVLFEIITHRNKKEIIKATTGTVVGSLAGIIANIVLGVLFIVLFILFASK